MHVHTRTAMHSTPQARWRAGRASHTRLGTVSARRCGRQLHAAKSPCIVVTAMDGIQNKALQELADQVSQQLQLAALVIAPAPNHSTTTTTCSSSSSSGASGSTCHNQGPGALTFDQQLDLQQHQDLGPTTFSLQGATPADCVLCAVDQTCGLANSLSLAPVMVLVGVARAPALSSDMDTHPAVAVARQAALLGLPALAVCLATTSPAAPLSPAVAATVQLLEPLIQLLRSNRSWPSPSNFPRAHFPFPEQGRWALGSQMPLPDNPAAGGGGSSSSSWKSYVSAATDCWALGEDNSWLGDYNSSRSSSSSSRRTQPASQGMHAAERRRQLLRSAWADGDALLCLNVPPTWKPSAGFAATRPGVLWHCWQVAAQGQLSQQVQATAGAGGYSNTTSSSSWRSNCDDSSRSSDEDSTGSWRSTRADSSSNNSSWRSGSSSSGAADNTPSWRTSQHSRRDGNDGHNSSSSSPETTSRSWQVDGKDLYGRTLPSTSYSSSGSTAAPAGSNFVGQDNTTKVASDISSSWGSSSSSRIDSQQRVLPSSFKVQRGTLLNDAAACGDVEAVFGGQAAVTLCQTWPAGHPLSLRDELLLAALDEGPGGLPAWLCEK